MNLTPIRFAVIDPATGHVKRTGICSEIDLPYQSSEGELLIEAEETPDVVSYFKDGTFKAYPTRPGAWSVFDYASEAWTDPRTQEDLSAAIDAARQSAITTVNRITGEIRSRFITVIPGQEMLYLLKEREAVDWLASSDANLTEFPLIAAEIGITGGPDADAYTVAQIYINMAHMLRQTAAQLEHLRLGAIAIMEGATDQSVIDAAMDHFMQSIPQ